MPVLLTAVRSMQDISDTSGLSRSDVMEIATESMDNRTSVRAILNRRDGASTCGGGPFRPMERDRISKIAKTISEAGGRIDKKWRVQVLPTWECNRDAEPSIEGIDSPEYSVDEQTSPVRAIPESMTFNLPDLDVPDAQATTDSFTDDEEPDDEENERLLAQLLLERDATQWDDNFFVQV